MESPKLKTLYDLLAEGYTVAQLATAIETHGVNGWDRFGRFGEHKSKSPGAEQALDALAGFYEEQQMFWDRMDTQPPESADDMALTTSEAPLEVARNFKTLAIHHFGWPRDKLPTMNRYELYPQVPRYARDNPNPLNLLRIIGALLAFLETLQRPYRKTELTKLLSERYSEVPGLAKSTLEKWFPAGENAFRQARQK